MKKCFVFLLLSASVAWSTTYNPTNYGAIGNCQQFYIDCTNGSAIIHTTNSVITSASVGSMVELFGAGAKGSYGFPGGYPETSLTNQQDLIASIISVSGNNVTISRTCSFTTNTLCTFGTNNSYPFQHAVDVATNGDTIQIPSGNFLLIPSKVISPTNTMDYYSSGAAAIVLQKGGIKFQGAGTNLTILTCVGAWQNFTNNSPDYTAITGDTNTSGARGFIIWQQGPVTNDGPVFYDGITFDGGVAHGKTTYDYWPVLPSNGDGWDVTHGAILDIGSAPIQQSVTIRNCSFIHWRGEILKSVVPLTDGLRVITNCYFYDGNASANNFSFTHHIDRCTFDTVKTAQEFYQGYSQNPSWFINSLITNINGASGGGIGIVIGGSEVGAVNPSYTISNNVFVNIASAGVFVGPIQNLFYISNYTYGATFAFSHSVAGFQGTTNSWNITLAGNVTSNCFLGFTFQGFTNTSDIHNISISNNFLDFNGASSQAVDFGGWGTNITFGPNNTVSRYGFGIYPSSQIQGQYMRDDISNVGMPPYQSVVYDPTNRIINNSHGRLWQIDPSLGAWYMDDSSGAQIPPGDVRDVINGTESNEVIRLSLTGSSTVTIPSGATNRFYWTGTGGAGVWQTNTPASTASSTLSIGTATFQHLIWGP